MINANEARTHCELNDADKAVREIMSMYDKPFGNQAVVRYAQSHSTVDRLRALGYTVNVGNGCTIIRW